VNTSEQRKKLADAVSALTPLPQHPALQHLVESLRCRHAACAVSILFYGSCLRSGDPYDGLVDLYLIVDSYRGANSSMARAFWNWLLPPNVFYAEFPYDGKTIRCKYAVLTLEDFETGTSPRWFHSYLWGRFSQPAAIAWSRSPDIHDRIANGLAQAVTTLLDRALPGVPASGSAQSLWQHALQLSYATELRPESHSRAQQLTEHNQDYYRVVTGLAAPLLSGNFTFSSDNHYHFQDSSSGRTLNPMTMALEAPPKRS